MYLSEIYLENTGPISKCHVHLPFSDNGNPRPVAIVGPNGSGKSISSPISLTHLRNLRKQRSMTLCLPVVQIHHISESFIQER